MEANLMTKATLEAPLLLTIQQLSEKLQVPVGTIYYWVSRREIPFVKINRLVRFDLNQVLKHFNIATTQTMHPSFELRKQLKKGY